MGFYAPAQIVRDAIGIMGSRGPGGGCEPFASGTARWRHRKGGIWALRLGLRMAKGLSEAARGARLVDAAGGAGVRRRSRQLWRRAGVPVDGAGAVGGGRCVRVDDASIGGRRLWAIRALVGCSVATVCWLRMGMGAPEPEVAETPVTLAPMRGGARGGGGLWERGVNASAASGGVPAGRSCSGQGMVDVRGAGAGCAMGGAWWCRVLVLVRQKPGIGEGRDVHNDRRTRPGSRT